MLINQCSKSAIISIFLVCYIVLSYPDNSSALPSNRVKNTIFNRQNSVETAIVQTEKLTRVTHFVLHEPERVVVDIHETFIPQVAEVKEVNGDIISGIRINQNQKNVVRAVLDINENIPYSFEVKQEYIGSTPGVKICLSSASLPVSLPDDEDSVLISEAQETGMTIALLDDTMPDDIFEESTPHEDASGFSISGEIRARGTQQIKEEDAVENNQSFRNKVFLEGKYKAILTLSVLSDYMYFGSENRNEEYDIDIHEAKWEHTGEKAGFSFGKQIIRWGKTDQISPVDTLNPEDLREFIIPEYEERKIPVWMADARLFSEYFTLEGVFIPFFEPAKIDYFDTNWSIFGHLKKELGINDPPVHEEYPDNETEFALRLATTIKRMDLGFIYHRAIEDTPFFKSFSLTNIEVEYQKNNILGLEFETTLRDFGVRGEVVWKENEPFMMSSLVSSRHPIVTSVIGADYTTASGSTYINIQFLHSHISDYSSDILFFDQNTFSLLGEFRVDLISDWLQGAVKYNFGLNNDSSWVSPYIKYTYITNFECIAGTNLFYGDSDTWFGRYSDYDLLFLEVLYQF